jgi:hypothetical protein
MRSLLDVNTEIAALIEQRGHFESKRQEATAKKRVQFLNVAKMYIETCPDEYFISKEIRRLENRINLLSKDAPDKKWKEAFKKYEKEMGIVELRQQLKALRFIKN